MAVTLEELELKFKSEIAAATSKDAAALARVDAATAKSAAGLVKLQQAHAGYASAARAAEKSGVVGDAQKARKAEASSAAKLGAAFGSHKELEDASPRLKALAREGAAAKAAAAADKASQREQAALVKRNAKESESALKRLAKARDDASDKAHEKSVISSQAAMLGAAGAAATFAAALVVGYGALVTFGIAAANTARDARILGEALTGSAELGAEFTTVVNQLAAKVPLAKEKIAALAQELELLKLGRADMQAGLGAIAVVTSALGDSAGSAVKSIVTASAASRRFSLGMRDRFGELTGLAGTGLKKADFLGALAKQLGKSIPAVEKQLLAGRVAMKDGLQALESASQGRFGKTIASQMLSLDTQFSKAKENIGAMFADVDIEPLLHGLKDLLSLFDQGTADGVVMKTVLTMGLQGISNALGFLLPLGKSFFLEMAIGAMEVYIAVRPIARKIKEWAEPLATAENAALAGKAAVYLLAGAFAVAGIAALAAVSLFLLPFAIIGAVVYGSVLAVQAAWDWLVNSGASAGTRLIDGLVGMIKAGVGRVVGAVKGLAKSAIGAFTTENEIHSPSKKWARMAHYNTLGLTEQYERDAPAVAASVEGIGGAEPSAPGAAAPARSGSAGGLVFTWTGDVYLSDGKRGGADVREQVRAGMIEAFIEAAGHFGPAPAGAT